MLCPQVGKHIIWVTATLCKAMKNSNLHLLRLSPVSMVITGLYKDALDRRIVTVFSVNCTGSVSTETSCRFVEFSLT